MCHRIPESPSKTRLQYRPRVLEFLLVTLRDTVGYCYFVPFPKGGGEIKGLTTPTRVHRPGGGKLQVCSGCRETTNKTTVSGPSSQVGPPSPNSGEVASVDTSPGDLLRQ